MKLIDYKLESDEVLLLELNCSVNTSTNKATGTLAALTNRNIILVFKGIFGGIKEIKKYSLGDVNMFQDRAAITLNEKLLDNSTIDINLKRDRLHISYTSEEKKSGKEFVQQLSKMITGDENRFNQTSFKGMTAIADSLKGTIGVFKKSVSRYSNKKIVIDCRGCGASLTTVKGKIVYCPYCDTPNQS